jgi:hydroxyethylthiazole kinase-like uncharacterized protein yjeF
VNEFYLGSFGKLRLDSDEPQRWAIPSAGEMQQLDRMTIESGSSSVELMERAGAAVVEELVRTLCQRPGPVLVLCGPGNNGGDGLVVARLLHQAGHEVVAVVAWAERYSDDFLFQLGRFPQARVVGPFPAALRDRKEQPLEIAKSDLPAVFSRAVVVVDALLGTGQQGELREAISDLVGRLQREKQQRPLLQVFAVDVPTGVCSDTGKTFVPHIVADKTVAFEWIKRGCLQFPGRAACGELVVHSVGIAPKVAVEFFCAEGSRLPHMQPRASDIHKGDLSRVLVVAGSRSMPGAAALACRGALHAGAGLVTRVVRQGWGAESSILEVVHLVLRGDEDTLGPVDLELLAPLLAKNDVVVVGPGIGTTAQAKAFLAGLFELLRHSATLKTSVSVVVDADALTIIAEDRLSLGDIRAIITPHPGEAGRLLGVSASEIQRDRFASARELATRYGVVALLKGAGTVIHGGRSGVVVARGTPFLATPGSGDVLAGVIASCVRRTSSLFDAAVVGAYVHAAAGEEASRKSGGVITASEVASAVAGVVGAL